MNLFNKDASLIATEICQRSDFEVVLYRRCLALILLIF